MDLTDMSAIFHKLGESSKADQTTRFEHDLSHICYLLSKLHPEIVAGVSIHNLYRIEQIVGSEITQKAVC